MFLGVVNSTFVYSDANPHQIPNIPVVKIKHQASFYLNAVAATSNDAGDLKLDLTVFFVDIRFFAAWA